MIRFLTWLIGAEHCEGTCFCSGDGEEEGRANICQICQHESDDNDALVP